MYTHKVAGSVLLMLLLAGCGDDKGSQEQLEATVVPHNSNNQALTWESLDPPIARRTCHHRSRRARDVGKDSGKNR